MDPGLFTEQGWKAVASKHKIKDNGLLKALIDYQKLAEDQYDGRLAAAALVSKLAGALRKDKQVAANTSVVKYLADLVDFADAVRGEIIKGKAAAEKSAAQAKQRQHSPHADEPNEEEDEETGDVIVRLKRALQSLKNSKEPFYFLACDAKPYGLVVSRKNIKSSAQHRKELVTLAGGSTRPPKFGTCRRDGNNLLFDMETPAPGLARILQKWIKINTGLPLKITVGDESADDEDGITQGEGQQIELPPVPPALEKAPELWLQTRQEIEASIDGLKDAIRKQFAEEGPAPIAEMEENVKKLDRVFDTLDDKLANALVRARAAKDGASRQMELNNAKSLLSYYIKYVKAEPLIAHIDANPFGVKTNLKQKLAETLTQVARAI